MPAGEWLTRLTAWLAFTVWGVAAFGMVRGGGTLRPPMAIAWLWLAGALVMALHTVCAFHFHHSWSHTAALAATARQTREMTGLDWGGGLWLNYLVIITWLTDAVFRLTAPAAHARRPRWVAVATQGFLGFIWFNATVVFGTWPMRIAGVIGFAVLGREYARACRQSFTRVTTHLQ